MSSPRRLIDVEVLKQGEALLMESRKLNALSMHMPVDPGRISKAERAWMEWASLYAGDLMLALKAYAALEEILDHSWITELIWWSTPGVWGLKTECDQTGESEGEWQAVNLHVVLCEAAADFATSDMLDSLDVSEEPPEPPAVEPPSSEELGYSDDDAVSRGPADAEVR